MLDLRSSGYQRSCQRVGDSVIGMRREILRLRIMTESKKECVVLVSLLKMTYSTGWNLKEKFKKVSGTVSI